MMVTCYILHLRRAEARLANVERLVSRFGPNARVVDAVDGVELPAAVLEEHHVPRQHWPTYPFALSPAEVGCFLSHRAAWQSLCNSGADAALILEDDVEPLQGFERLTEFCLSHMTPVDYVRFPLKPRRDKGKQVARSGEMALIEPSTPGLGTIAQLVGRGAAENLLAVTERFDRPIDTFLQLRWLLPVRILAAEPKLIRERGFGTKGSTIHSKNKSLSEWVSRELQRPAYRFLVRSRNALAACDRLHTVKRH